MDDFLSVSLAFLLFLLPPSLHRSLSAVVVVVVVVIFHDVKAICQISALQSPPVFLPLSSANEWIRLHSLLSLFSCAILQFALLCSSICTA